MLPAGEPVLLAQGDPCAPPLGNPIVCENQLPGDPPSQWDVSGAGDLSIQGFATDMSVTRGQTISFKINTNASDYRLDIYRMGYYSGMGARRVATITPSVSLPQSQPACLTEPASGLIDCGNWAVSATWAVPSTAVSGIYFAKVIRTNNGGASHIVFIVRDDTGQSDLLLQTSDTTWQAYNQYGGNSLYVGAPAGRAYKVSYNRPFTTRESSPQDWVFNAEYPMVRWLEANGYNVSYFSGVDSDRYGAEILEHRVFLSVGHDEYWSATQRANVEAARAAGVHLAFFSGNEVFWKTRWENSLSSPATSHRTLVSYKETHANAKIDPSPEWTGTWRDPRFSPPSDGGHPENSLTGTIYMVNCCTYAITVPAAEGRMRLWRNTSAATLLPGQVAELPSGTLGYEWDEDLDNGFRPAGLVRLSDTTVTPVQRLVDYGSTYDWSGTGNHALTLYRHPSGALVFGAGTIQWSWGLDGNHDRGGSTPSVLAQQATVNLFADMGVQPLTVQAGLATATASTDVLAPTSMVTSPLDGSTVLAESTITISGTAIDVGDGQVGGVEVSVDGGASWRRATGRASWTYSWQTGAPRTVTILSRAVDDSGNLEQPMTANTVTVSNQPDTTPPQILQTVPVSGATNVAVTQSVAATFDEAMDASTIGGATFELRGPDNVLVPATVSYAAATRLATLQPASVLSVATVYTARVRGAAGGVRDLAGNPLASDAVWSFTTAGSPPPPATGPGGPIVVIASSTNRFTEYVAEILRVEGLNAFSVVDIGAVTPSLLAGYDVAILGQVSPLTGTQVTTLSDWVQAGGNLITMRPDTQLAGLLGLNALGTTLADRYLEVNTAGAPGAGIVAETMQFHGTADLYSVVDATVVARLFSNATTPTTSPAVTVRSVGTAGGQAAAFTYDLARSVVYTRQGNPAWAGQERDGEAPIRADDLFYGGTEADYVDLTRVAIPQADEQQRLLANLIGFVTRDRTPLPRFWYFPSGHKAVVVMTGDDHGNNGTSGQFDFFNTRSAPGCSVDDWECVRGTSYIYPYTPIPPAQASAYVSQGFEIGVHVTTNCANYTPSSLSGTYTTDIQAFAAAFTALPAPRTNRTHCIPWSDYDGQPAVALDHGIRLDTNYYFWPPGWVNNTPGLFTGSGMPMRFARLDGAMVDVYQATTQMTDESGQQYPFTADTLLDRALGPEGYYGAFVANMHTDHAFHSDGFAIVDSAQARGVPVITARQLLDWVDGRNQSTFGSIGWNGSTLSFAVTAGAGARNLQAMVPAVHGSAVLTNLTRDGVPVSFTSETVKGVAYAMFAAAAGLYQATYTVDTTGPVISALGASATPESATITWTTSEPATSRVDYGTSPTALTSTASVSGLSTSHSVPLSGLVSNTTYYYRVTSADLAGYATTAPAPPQPPAEFVTAASPYTCPCTIWAPTQTPAVASASDSSPIELGLRWRSQVNGFVTGVRFYKGAQNTGVHTGTLWSNTGTPLATVTFANEPASGWQEATFSTPVPVTANTVYVVSYHTSVGNYAFDLGYFQSSGVVNGPLEAPATGVAGANGVYRYGASAFPTDTYNGSNYWVDVVFSTTTQGDTTPPVVTALGATPSASGATITWTTNEAATSRVDYGTSPSALTSTAGVSGLATAHSVTLTGLSSQTTYYYRVLSADAAGNATTEPAPPASPATFTTTTAGTYNCPCTVWPSTQTPAVANANEVTPIELGLRWRSQVDGLVTGVRFYKGSQNTGVHTGSLWTNTGTLLATVTFNNETASGWQEATFSSPVAVTANTPYVVSYHTNVGYYSFDLAYFESSGVTRGPLEAPATGVIGANGVYRYGGSAFPTDTYNGSNYWVDVVFATTTQTDTTPPTVVSSVPANGATDVDVTSGMSVTFSEELDPGTVSPATFELRDAASAVVPVAVNYGGATVVTLQPTGALSPQASYTIRVVGGASGVRDVAGNPLAADWTATFTTELAEVGDTTAADFAAGSFDTGIYIAQSADGELMLSPSLASEFSDGALSAGWSGTLWSGTGTFGVAGGALTVDGARVSADALAGSGGSLAFRATFSTDTLEHAGFGVSLTETPWAIFSTATGGGLYARTHDGVTPIDTLIAGNWLGTPHTYRIDWNSGTVVFFIDGVQVASHAATIGSLMRPIVSDSNTGGGSLSVDWLRLTPYATSGTFTSRVLTMGGSTDWVRARWTATVPGTTTLTVAARFGSTPTPDGSWTGFIPLPTPETTLAESSVYVQYQATFAGTGVESPVLGQVTFAGTEGAPAGVPGAPTGVSAVAGNAQATVSFTPPASDGGSPIISYTVTPYIGAAAQSTTTGASSPITVPGLTNGTTYTFRVAATNGVGTGPASAASNAVTPATLPGAPTGVTAAAGNGQATVSFTPPASDGGSAITGYAVTPYIGAAAQPTTTGAGSPITVPGLTNGTTYTITVAATNGVGTGPASAASNAVTPAGVPGVPTGVTAAAGNAQATVSFTPPAADGGSPITSYTVTPYIGAAAQPTATGAGSPITVPGLTNGTTYTFTVAATNGVGTGPASGASNTVTPATTPGAPTNATSTAGNGQATVSFTPPASNGGSAITSYTVTPYIGAAAQPTTTGAGSPITVPGLTNGTTYTFTVAATNGVGTGPASTASNAVTPSANPPVTTTVTLTSMGTQDGWVLESSETSNAGGTVSATGTGGSALRIGDATSDRQYKAVLSFDTSSIPDGGIVTGVVLELTRGGGSGTSPFATHGALQVDVQTGGFGGNVALEAGDFQAAATAVGVATMTAVSTNGQVSSGSFDAAGLAAVNMTGTTQVRLSFSRDDNDDGGNDYVGFYSGSNGTSGNHPRLIVTYSLVPTVPGAPTAVAAEGGNGQATVTFAAPADDGGSAITSYTITPHIGEVAQAPTVAAGSPATVAGLTNGTTYTFTVAATNAVGTGLASAPSNPVTPSNQPVTVTLTSVGTQDGWVRESSETSNAGGSTSATSTSGTAVRAGDDSSDRQYKGVLSFDTSAVPDGATITSVTLELTRGGGSGTNPFTTHGSLLVDVQSGGFGGDVTLASGDFQSAATAVGVATMSSVSANGQVSSGAFNATGLAAVNRAGTTQVRLSFTLDDNDDGGNDYIGFYASENSTAGNRPRLIVTYTP